MTEELPSASAPRINKIPFIVFDAILVVTALVLALTAGGPLSPLLFFWILFCVAAGGVIACLPFWIEFRDSVRLAEYEIRERQNGGGGNAQWQYVDARLSEVGDLLNRTHLRLSDNGDRLTRLEAQLGGLDISAFAAQAEAAQQSRWPALREELLAALSQRNTELMDGQREMMRSAVARECEQAGKESSKKAADLQVAVKTLDDRVVSLAETLASLAALTAALQAAQSISMAAPGAGSTEASPASPVLAATEQPVAEDEEAEDAGVDDFAVQSDAEETAIARDADADLALDAAAADSDAFDSADGLDEDSAADPQYALNADAATDNDEAADGAESFGDEDTDSTDALDEEAAEPEAASDFEAALDEDASDSEALADEEAVLWDEAGYESDPEVDLDDVEIVAAEIAADVEAVVDADIAAEEAALLAELEREEKAKRAVAQQQTLIDEPQVAPVTAKTPAKGAAAERTTLVAQVLIGIGNKPYVRGEGPGLSMEKGVPMQFVEIGKWEWICPAGDAPLKVQIYKNDEVPSGLGEIVLEPGQRRAVTPTFPK